MTYNFTYTITTGVDGVARIIRSDGAIIPNDPDNSDFKLYESRRAAGETFPSATITVALSRQLSPLEFQALFTQAEMTAIETAAMSSVALFGWMTKMESADYIDLDEPLTIEGLGALVTAGLLTADRRTAILSATAPS